MPTFCRMKEKPTAVISGASLGAFRKGRYATRSIITFSTPQATIATRPATISPPRIPMPEVASPTPSVLQSRTTMNEPIMKISPWAKLISSMIP